MNFMETEFKVIISETHSKSGEGKEACCSNIEVLKKKKKI